MSDHAVSLFGLRSPALPIAAVTLTILTASVVRGTTSWGASAAAVEPIKLCLLFVLAVVAGSRLYASAWDWLPPPDRV